MADVTRSRRRSHAFVLCVFPGVGYRVRNGCLTAAVVLGCCFGNPESLLSGATPDPSEPAAQPGCRFAAAADAGPAAGEICDRVGAKLAASGAAFDRRRTVSGGVLGRVVAGAAVSWRAPSGLGLFALLALAALFPLLRFRWPSREEGLSRLDRGTGIRHRPATALTDTLATPGSGGAGAVAGAARAHAGLDQAHPRRPAVAAAGDPRSLGAARAGRGDDGGDLCRRGRRAHAADRGGVRLERRAVAGQYPGRCLGDAAALYRQAADHPVGGQQGSRDARRRAVAGSGGLAR